MSPLLRSIAASALFASLAFPAQAGWELDASQSRVNFVSIKNGSKAEVHHFKALSGGIDDAGQARLTIDLDSVDTLVPIRDQRMRELLFETVRFSAATLTLAAPEALLSLDPGVHAETTVEATLDLHGQTQPVTAKLSAVGMPDGGLQVSLAEPILIDAAMFGLAEGIGTLQEIAGLASIATAVPVTAQLVFRAVD